MARLVAAGGGGPAARPYRWRRLWPWFVLWPWSAACAAWHLPGAGQSWHFMATGGRLLLSGQPGGGLHLYAAHPQLQIGPLTLAVSGTLGLLFPGHSRLATIAAMSLTGPPLLAAIWRLVPAARQRRGRLFLAGLFFLPVWTEVTTHFAHLDDLLALSFSVAAMHAVTRRYPVLAGLALAAAADAKPWAAAFAPMLLTLPRRQWWGALGSFTAAVAALWLPFLLADPHTLSAARFTIPNDPSSALRVLGVNTPRTPWWDRPAQLVLGAAGGCVAVWRHRWQGVILVALSARILLDPGVYPYYTSGALLGTVIVDLVVTSWRIPWTTAAGVVLLYTVRFTREGYAFTLPELGMLRAGFALGIPALALGMPGWLMARAAGRHARMRVPAPARGAAAGRARQDGCHGAQGPAGGAARHPPARRPGRHGTRRGRQPGRRRQSTPRLPAGLGGAG